MNDKVKNSTNNNDLQYIVFVVLVIITTIGSYLWIMDVAFNDENIDFLFKLFIFVLLFGCSALVICLLYICLFEITKVVVGEYVVKIDNKKHVERLVPRTAGKVTYLQKVDYYYIYVVINNQNIELSVSKEQYNLLFENDEVLVGQYKSKLKFLGNGEKFEFIKRCS